MRIKGELEIDCRRGVIYFHRNNTGQTVLRICRLGKLPKNLESIDISHMIGKAVEVEAR